MEHKPPAAVVIRPTSGWGKRTCRPLEQFSVTGLAGLEIIVGQAMHLANPSRQAIHAADSVQLKPQTSNKKR
jgi:hypothetical protein